MSCKFLNNNNLYSGDLMSSDGGNNIPVMAIVFAVVSSFNSVGVSIYQEQLFKVRLFKFLNCKASVLNPIRRTVVDLNIPKRLYISFRTLVRISWSNSSGCTCTVWAWQVLSTSSPPPASYPAPSSPNSPPPPATSSSSSDSGFSLAASGASWSPLSLRSSTTW